MTSKHAGQPAKYTDANATVEKAWILKESVMLKYFFKENILYSLLVSLPATHSKNWKTVAKPTER